MSRAPKSTDPVPLREAVKRARKAADVDPANATGPEWLRRRFRLFESGLSLVRDETLHWICAPLTIEAETRDEYGGWGLLLAWHDRDGRPRSEIFPRELFAGDCRDIRGRLAAGGLTMAGDQKARTAFAEFLNVARSDKRARSVGRTGWHRIDGRRVFVLPDQVVGAGEHSIIPVPHDAAGAIFGIGGTLEGWRQQVAALAEGNSRVVFAISAAFAGPLLDIAGEEGAGINLKGPSRIGKTTLLRAAASVWGGDQDQGAAGYIRQWRSTGNGLEAVAAQFSDTFLVLDELGQVDGAEIADIAYMLSNGSGKTRAQRDGSSRAPTRWRILFLSSGEVGMADKAAEAKRATKTGQEIRLLDVEADAGAGWGVFEQLYDFPSADALAEALRAATRAQYGTAGRAFLEWLVEQLQNNAEFVAELRDRIERLIATWLRMVPDAGAQVRSVARRFALVGVAGEFASAAGITAWPAGDAAGAARGLFQGWLTERGTPGAAEEQRAVDQLAAFISRHGPSRFEVWVPAPIEPMAATGFEMEHAPAERFRPPNRAGWRRWAVNSAGDGGWTYYLTRDGMTEALAGLDFRPALKALVEAGMIIPDRENKSMTKARPPGVDQPIRLYVVPGRAVGGSMRDAAD